MEKYVFQVTSGILGQLRISQTELSKSTTMIISYNIPNLILANCYVMLWLNCLIIWDLIMFFSRMWSFSLMEGVKAEIGWDTTKSKVSFPM